MAIIIKRKSSDGVIETVKVESVAVPLPLPTNLFTVVPASTLAKIQDQVNKDIELLGEFKVESVVKVHNLFMDAVANSVAPEPVKLQPWDVDTTINILGALVDFAAKKFPPKCKHLKIVHKTMPQHTYTVKEFDPSSGRAKLEGGFKGGLLKPVITEREDILYYPVWY